MDEVRGRRGAEGDDLSLVLHLIERGLASPELVAEHVAALSGLSVAASVGAGPSATLLPGYELVRELGRGGMGVVYEVRHLATAQHYAHKQVLPATCEEADLQRFAREARLLASLEHPGLVRVHSAHLEGEAPCFVQEFVPGGSLQQRLREGPLGDFEQVVQILREVADALGYRHGRGVLHRDLKPENVLFDAEGHARVTDFGLARARGGLTLTQTGEVLGTPAYMSPEQITDSRGVDERSDVYALGALCYAMLTGQPPFRRGSVFATLDAVLREAPPAPSSLNPGVPPALEALCLRALAKDPSGRPASAAAFAQALEVAPPGQRGACLARGLAVLGGAALLAWAGWWSSRPREEPTPSAALDHPELAESPKATHGARDRPQVADLQSGLPARLRLPPSAKEWSLLCQSTQRRPSGSLYEELHADLLRVVPELGWVALDWRLLRLLEPKEQAQQLYADCRALEPLSRASRAAAWGCFQEADDLGHLAQLEERQGRAESARALRVLRVLNLEQAGLASVATRAPPKFSPGSPVYTDLDLAGFLGAGVEAGLELCQQALDGRGLLAPPDAWAWLLRENARVWTSVEVRTDEETRGQRLPREWPSETQRLRALRVLNLVCGEGEPEWLLFKAETERVLGAWPEPADLRTPPAELPSELLAELQALRVARRSSEDEQRRWIGLELANVLRGPGSLVRAATSIRKRLEAQEGITERAQCQWLLVALVGFDSPAADPNPSETLKQLSRGLAGAGWPRAGAAAALLSEENLDPSRVAQSLLAAVEVPKSIREVWEWFEAPLRIARRVELGEADVLELAQEPPLPPDEER